MRSRCWLSQAAGWIVTAHSETLEFSQEITLAHNGVAAAVEVVGAELVVGRLLVKYVPGDNDEAVGDGEDGLALCALPNRRLKRRYWA